MAAPRRFRLTTIARTGERFEDFSPYVPSIAGGRVAFQAATAGGGTGLFTGDGREVGGASAPAGPLVAEFRSHPDFDASGALCAYGVLRTGGEALVRVEDGRESVLAGPADGFERIGPLGPTTDGSGSVAFRADLAGGESGTFLARAGRIETIATTATFAGFHGLPVACPGGVVVFRADHRDGSQAIHAGGATQAELVRTGGAFVELGRFPAVNARGDVAFAARRSDGSAGVFVLRGGDVTCCADTSGPFESFRGALLDDEGRLFFYAVPRGKALGVFAGPDPQADAILTIGDPLLESSVVELALNPVSVDGTGQLALRVRLADGTQAIVRADPR